MERIGKEEGLLVRQQKEWGEILTGFETRNRYVVCDNSGREIYAATELPGQTLLRILLRAWRPFEMDLTDFSGKIALRLLRPFRFFLSRMEVFDPGGEYLGRVQQRFSFLRRVYSLNDPGGREVFQLWGPLLRPWTFIIRQEGRETGRITKRWSGMIKECCTDADNFQVSLPREAGIKERSLILASVFLIDFTHFENKGKN